METNTIYCGDCLENLKKLKDDSIDLIYLDPPFFSQREYENFWIKDKVSKFKFSDKDWHKFKDKINPNILKQYEDIEKRWKGRGHSKGIYVYIAYMRERLEQCWRVLKPTGSIYLHCDFHAGHYLKVMMDEVFDSNFISEIVWRRKPQSATITSNTRSFGNNHDIILFYSKTDSYKFNRLIIEKEVDKKLYQKDSGGYFKSAPADAPNQYCKATLQKMLAEGRAYKTKGNRIRKKYYLTLRNNKLYDTKPVDNIWSDISNIMHVSKKERLGYPTQKPEALLDRIIRTSSKEGDIVLDPFCGCGTTIAVANRLNRKWIGIDISRTACDVMKNRLGNKNIKIIGGENQKELSKMEPHEFARILIAEKLGGTPNPKKSGDLGIDGWIDFMACPVQVKRWGNKVGRQEVDKFKSAIQRDKKNKGMIIAFDFSGDCYNEVERIKSVDKIDIKLKKVSEIIGFEYWGK